ncbi:MAG TPA: peptidoglycan DD-metalloendopeptidase family protein [Bacilli bacterium]|nr:peptidoglycan DD-metalloendopeptidase family protein [Bacilli bacterium]
MSFKNTIITILFTIFVASLVFMVGFTKETTLEPKEVYQVYLDGKKIGLIEDKDALYDLINKEGQDIKEQYGIDQVYPPNGLEITKYITYDEKITEVKKIYEEIKAQRPFTIIAYTITIKPVDGEEKRIYVLNEDVFKEAVNSFIYAFISEDEYKAFINNTQKEIETTGEIIEAMDFNETVTIKKSYVNAEENIFVDADNLSQYLLFGTTEKQKTYVVKSGEDVETIAYNNKLNTQEFLIANPTFTSENQLLSPGQIVNIGLIDPVVSLIYEKYVVVDEESAYETEIEYSASLSPGTRYVKQQGENGVDRETQKVKYLNGEIQGVEIVSSTEIKPSVSKIIVKGASSGTITIGDGAWKWPTQSPYTITSPYGYRWGKLHKGIDIASSYGSPIYAIEDGIVVYDDWQNSGGNVVEIDHLNGYFSEYGHLSKVYVEIGQTVKRGDVIGAMGKTGYVTGTHLHFGIWIGMPWASGSYTINPLRLYQ